jgi:hypothetical protein
MLLTIEYRRRPSALAYMARAFHRSPAFDVTGGFPGLRLVWRNLRIDRSELAVFTALTGLRAPGSVPLLYPHVAGFRLLMSLLTHPAWPLPIWRALQVRNHLLQQRPLEIGQPFDLHTSVGQQRMVDKGLEVDLLTQARVRDFVVWTSVVTVYYRGRFGQAGASPPLARAPDPGQDAISQWRTQHGGGVPFGRLTGDYNGIHLWSPYARLFGFSRAFQHPQRVLGQCMARLPDPGADRPQRLDAWLKGPVCYGAEVVLRGRSQRDATTFGLFADGDPRPAIVGCWSPVTDDLGLLPGELLATA